MTKFTLQRVRLNSGGYDSSGSYWGHGQRLYWFTSDDGSREGTCRAADRDGAKAHIRQTTPDARFYR
jgi:hypothetical protein